MAFPGGAGTCAAIREGRRLNRQRSLFAAHAPDQVNHGLHALAQSGVADAAVTRKTAILLLDTDGGEAAVDLENESVPGFGAETAARFNRDYDLALGGELAFDRHGPSSQHCLSPHLSLHRIPFAAAGAPREIQARPAIGC